MATLKMSVTNSYCGSSEGCPLLGEEGGMTRNDGVEDKEMDEAGQETEKGEWSEITQMKTSKNGESSQSPKKEGSWLGYKRTQSHRLGFSYRTRSA